MSASAFQSDQGADPGCSSNSVTGLISELSCVREELLRSGPDVPASVHPDQRDSAINLRHYLTLRQRDLRELQSRLAELGLSSLGRSEAHVAASVDAVLGTLYQLEGRAWNHPVGPAGVEAFRSGPRRLEKHAEALLGPVSGGRNARIMVTMPPEAAGDYRLVHDLIRNGMDCMRINCAHDGPVAWAGMIENKCRAERALGLDCKLMMDLAGPKLRTGPMAPGPQVIKYRPRRDLRGRVVEPARIWLTAVEEPFDPPTTADARIEVPGDWLARLGVGDTVRFRDTRGAHRSIEVLDVAPGGSWLVADRTAYIAPGIPLPHSSTAGGPGGEGIVCGVPERELVIRVVPGDLLIVTPDGVPGRPATRDGAGKLLTPASIGCTLPEVLAHVQPGEEIWFDDGKIGGEVEELHNGSLHVRIRHTGPRGGKLRGDRGINLPATVIELPAMTEKDLCDLEFVARHADMVALSFANTVDDVRTLMGYLAVYGDAAPAVVLKIETVNGFRNLPAMLSAAMAAPLCGVMIARGDLAVESGFERLAEVQEEILWLCEAAHVPVIWATQVLESLAKTGAPTRAEITDAAMGHRAECVMLNKGPHILETVRALDNILRRMQGHQFKKQSMLRELRLAGTRLPED